jgi:FkbM family methyltransferase
VLKRKKEMRVDDSIRRLRDAYRGGTLARDDYWRRMQARHRAVHEYGALLDGGGPLHHVELHGDGPRLVLRNGLRFAWDPEEIRTATSVLVNDGEYEAEERAVLLRLARGCRAVLDVGANVGWYALHLAQAVAAEGGTVTALEPVPATYAMLRRNLALNPELAAAVRTVPTGLGAQAGTVRFFIPAFQGSAAASQSKLFPADENRAVEVRVERLDDWAPREGIPDPDLLKCDVEGAELFVLRGAERTLARARPAIMLEMLRKWAAKFDYHPDEIIRLLAGHGYAGWYVEAGRMRRLDRMGDDVAAVNFFFLHAERHAESLAGIREGLPLEEWLR